PARAVGARLRAGLEACSGRYVAPCEEEDSGDGRDQPQRDEEEGVPRVEALAERVARDVAVEGGELPERLHGLDERRERVHEVRADGERDGETHGERLPPRS